LATIKISQKLNANRLSQLAAMDEVDLSVDCEELAIA